MNRILPCLALAAVAGAACTPEVDGTEQREFVVARFDPAQSPPVVPTPNSLAVNPATGLLNVTPAANASPADVEFTAWLNTLNGFPAGASANATFTGELNAETVTAQTVRIFDVTDGMRPVENYSPQLGEPGANEGADARQRLSIAAPTGGWTAGHTYAVAIIGGENGMKGAGGQPVIGSSTWALIRSENPLVTCENLESPDCRTTTEIIPSTIEDPAERLADQTASALRLEALRRVYKPMIDGLVASGVRREDIALLWTFPIADTPTALFNPGAVPPQVPLPNDLAIDPATGLVNAPIDPSAPPAQQEFTRDYLNTLDGFPVTAGASARVVGRGLDPSTVNAETVRVMNLADPMSPPDVTISYDEETDEILVAPPTGGWPKEGRFAVVLTTGMRGDNGAALAASDAWALARSTAPLVDCEDLASESCRTVLTAAPLSNAQAVALERVRRGFAPVLDALTAAGLPRDQVALAWTFRIVSFAEATFDPGASVIPFPNNILLRPTEPPQVNLPTPSGAPETLRALYTGLNTLDGFSTIGPYVSENSPTRGALDIGELDQMSLADGTGFVRLSPLIDGGAEPQVSVCINCWSSEQPDGSPQDGPQELQFVTEAPLDERTTYAAFLTSSLRDTRGKKIIAAPAFALVRMESPLVDGEGRSQVSGVSDENAAALEPVRQGHQALIAALVGQGIERRDLALAWGITTQSTVSMLNLLHEAPGLGMLPANPSWAANVTPVVLGDPKPPTFAAIGTVFAGELIVPFGLNGPAGTLNPNPAAWTARPVPFLLAIPDPAVVAPPAGGYPTVIFGHGLRGGRQMMLALANSYAAAGQAVIAIDHVMHGDRSDCRGAASAIGAPSDDAACADPATQTCSAMTGRCVARSAATRLACDPTAPDRGQLTCQAAGQGACVVADSLCEGGDFLRDPATQVARISGWNYLDPSNLFATRDRFRAPVADLAQVARVLNGTGGGSLNALVQAQGGGALNGAALRYTGQSLGGIIGTLYTAASPAVETSLLNVPGSDPTGILLSSPAFSSVRDAFIASLSAQGITEGTQPFDNFIHIARWILDPADPQSAAYAMLNGPRAPAGRSVLVQYITEDQVIPNWTTERLIRAANRGIEGQRTVGVSLFEPSLGDLPLAARHGFLLNGTHLPTTGAAQAEAAALMSSGTLP